MASKEFKELCKVARLFPEGPPPKMVYVAFGPVPQDDWETFRQALSDQTTGSFAFEDLNRAMANATVLPIEKGAMMFDVAGAIAAYDTEKVMRELKAFFEEPDKEAP